MNNQNPKAPFPLYSSLKAVGRLKRPSKQPTTIVSQGKKNLLKQYSTVMQQKLLSLKQKINLKKKQKNQDQSMPQKVSKSNLQKFISNKASKQAKNIHHKLQVQQFAQFLSNNNLKAYEGLLLQNQIDTLQILAQATQKQLEQIGIPKGHSLKMKVNVGRLARGLNPDDKNKQQLVRQSKTKDSDRNESFITPVQSYNQNKTEVARLEQYKGTEQPGRLVESICIGTADDDIQQVRFALKVPTNGNIKKISSKFCLFCYQSIKQEIPRSDEFCSDEFCSDDCQDRYNQMFKKYQNNLVKAQSQFKSSSSFQSNNKFEDNGKNQQDLEQNNSDQHNRNQFDFLDDADQVQDLDLQSYNQLKKQLGQN